MDNTTEPEVIKQNESNEALEHTASIEVAAPNNEEKETEAEQLVNQAVITEEPSFSENGQKIEYQQYVRHSNYQNMLSVPTGHSRTISEVRSSSAEATPKSQKRFSLTIETKKGDGFEENANMNSPRVGSLDSKKYGNFVDYIAGTDFAPMVASNSTSPLSPEQTLSPIAEIYDSSFPPTLPTRNNNITRRFGQLPNSPPQNMVHNDLTNNELVRSLVKSFSQLESGCEPLWERSRLCINSCKVILVPPETILTSQILTKFLRRSAALEEEAAKNLLKMTSTFSKELDKEEIKSGTFYEALKSTITSHEKAATTKLKLASHTYSIAEELSQVAKENETRRKLQRDNCYKLKKALSDSEATLDKVKTRYLLASEAWDKSIVAKLEQSQEDIPFSPLSSTNNGTHKFSPTHHRDPSQGSGSGKPVNPIVDAFNNMFAPTKGGDNLRKVEDEARIKATSAKRLYLQNYNVTNHLRHDYFHQQLPDFITESISTIESCDKAASNYFSLYVLRLRENLIDQQSIFDSPLEEDASLQTIVQNIDNDKDNIDYFSPLLTASKPSNRNPLQQSSYKMSSIASSVLNPKTVYGTDLNEQLLRDRVVIPPLVQTCVDYVELKGMAQEGLYRRSGSSSKIQKLKDLFNLDAAKVNLIKEECEIDNVTGALKLYLRELPTGTIPATHWNPFLASQVAESQNPGDGIHLLRLAIDSLPKANHDLVLYLLNHLSKVAQNEKENLMGSSNLAIVFGPTLFQAPQGTNAVEVMGNQCGITRMMINNADILLEGFNLDLKAAKENLPPPALPERH